VVDRSRKIQAKGHERLITPGLGIWGRGGGKRVPNPSQRMKKKGWGSEGRRENNPFSPFSS